ncbi:unnamed protein product [Adineta steineri]|uniref:Glycine zipper domain-containing protein n=1 Tax=Adineta steineri TaxID=433720 RepID=A0A814QJU6_9BILA|nr:unnamed protein product [Adineta steineri]CAF1129107.1 unnamed protein product [Adineta steineri]CAF3841509.1 unnamed protein product [Adineta steineri]CAF4026583.1 unnamed protein product [Adineta steineri]
MDSSSMKYRAEEIGMLFGASMAIATPSIAIGVGAGGLAGGVAGGVIGGTTGVVTGSREFGQDVGAFTGGLVGGVTGGYCGGLLTPGFGHITGGLAGMGAGATTGRAAAGAVYDVFRGEDSPKERVVFATHHGFKKQNSLAKGYGFETKFHFN